MMDTNGVSIEILEVVSMIEYVCIGQLADQACHRVDPPGATETEMH